MRGNSNQVLRVYQGIDRAGFATSPLPCPCHHDVKNFFPDAADTCPAIKGMDSGIRREIMGQRTPFAAVVHQIENGVYQAPLVMYTIRPLWKEFLDLFPLAVCQVARAICWHEFHCIFSPSFFHFTSTAGLNTSSKKSGSERSICFIRRHSVVLLIPNRCAVRLRFPFS